MPISKLYQNDIFFVGFTDVEIYPTLNDVVSATKFHRIFVVSISAAISAWHIALLNSKRYRNGMLISDLPIQMSTIDGWYRVLNGIASYLYRLTAIVISVQHNVVSKLCFFVNHRFADVVSRYPSDIKWSTWCSRGTPSSILFQYRARYRPGIIPTSIDRHRHGDGPPIMISFHFRSVFDLSHDLKVVSYVIWNMLYCISPCSLNKMVRVWVIITVGLIKLRTDIFSNICARYLGETENVNTFWAFPK